MPPALHLKEGNAVISVLQGNSQCSEGVNGLSMFLTWSLSGMSGAPGIPL